MADNQSVFGQSSLRDLNSWIDVCRLKVVSSKGLSSKYGETFTNPNLDTYNYARDEITNIIQKNRSISIEMLLKSVSNELIINPNIKNVIIDICKDGDVNMTSKTNVSSNVETDFVLTFVKRKPVKEKVNKQIKHNYINSNVEDVLDGSFYASGRKLEFEKKDKVEKELNYMLKKPVKKTEPERTTDTNFNDVRNLLNNKPKYSSNPNITVQNIPLTTIPEKIKKEKEFKIKEIDIFSIKKNETKEIPQKTIFDFEPVKKVKPSKPKIKKRVLNINPDVFEKYSEYEILTILETLKCIKPVNKDHKLKINSTIKIAKIYAKAKKSLLTGGQKFGIFILSCLIITSIFIPLACKSKTIKEVKNDFYERTSLNGLQKTIEEERQKYNDVFIKYEI